MTVKCRAVTTRCTKHVFTILKRKSKFLWRLVAFACDPRSPKFMQSPPIESYRGWWTIPFFSCKTRRWLISYSVNVKPPDVRPGLVYQLARKYFRSRNIKCNVNLGFERLDRLRWRVREFISMDIDISGLEVNQCDTPPQSRDKLETPSSNQITFFKSTHKCHTDTTQVNNRAIFARKTIREGFSCFRYSACTRDPGAEWTRTGWVPDGRRARTCANVGRASTAPVISAPVSTGSSWKVRTSRVVIYESLRI